MIKLHRKFRLRLTIFEVVTDDAPRPGGAIDSLQSRERLEHVCAYEADVIVNALEAMNTTVRYWVRHFESAAFNIIRSSEAQIAVTLRR